MVTWNEFKLAVEEAIRRSHVPPDENVYIEDILVDSMLGADHIVANIDCCEGRYKLLVF